MTVNFNPAMLDDCVAVVRQNGGFDNVRLGYNGRMQIIVDRFVGNTSVERLRIYDAEQFVGEKFYI